LWSKGLQSLAEGNDNIQIDGDAFELVTKNAEVSFSVITDLLFQDCITMQMFKEIMNPNV